MGVFKKFVGGIVVEELMLESELTGQYKNFSVPSFRDVGGTSRTQISFGATSNFVFNTIVPFVGLIPVATADDISDYSISDYVITEVGTTSYSKTKAVTSERGTLTYAISVTNNTADSITVKCVKFKKKFYKSTSSASETVYVLSYAYYLDQNEWLTIPAGETEALAVVLKVGVSA